MTNYLIFAHVKCKGHSCTYPREKIVPVSEVSFLKDQISTRSMCIQTQYALCLINIDLINVYNNKKNFKLLKLYI